MDETRGKAIASLSSATFASELTVLVGWAQIAGGAELGAAALVTLTATGATLPVLLTLMVLAPYMRDRDIAVVPSFINITGALNSVWGMASVLPSAWLSPHDDPTQITRITSMLVDMHDLRYSESAADSGAILLKNLAGYAGMREDVSSALNDLLARMRSPPSVQGSAAAPGRELRTNGGGAFDPMFDAGYLMPGGGDFGAIGGGPRAGNGSDVDMSMMITIGAPSYSMPGGPEYGEPESSVYGSPSPTVNIASQEETVGPPEVTTPTPGPETPTPPPPPPPTPETPIPTPTPPDDEP